MGYIKQGISGLFTSLRQGIINYLSHQVFLLKKRETIRMCKEYNTKYYLLQQGYFKWQILRAKDINHFKDTHQIDKNINAINLAELAAFVANPAHINKPKSKK